MLSGEAENAGVLRRDLESSGNELVNLIRVLRFLAEIGLPQQADEADRCFDLAGVELDAPAQRIDGRRRLALRLMPARRQVSRLGRSGLMFFQVGHMFFGEFEGATRDHKLAQALPQDVPVGILGQHLLDDEASAGAALWRRRHLRLRQNHAEMLALIEIVAGEFEIAAQIFGGAVELAVLLGLAGLPEQGIGNVARLKPMQPENGAAEKSKNNDEKYEEFGIELAHGSFPSRLGSNRVAGKHVR